MTHTGFKHRKSISKKRLKRLLALGACSVEMADGRKVTDWREVCGMFSIQRDVNSGVIEVKQVCDSFPDWTTRQLEHVGDAVFCLAARLLCREFFGNRQGRYFSFADRFLANSVMGGTAAEVDVGVVFVKEGVVRALAYATERLKETQAYSDMVNYDESLRKSPNWIKQKQQREEAEKLLP